MSTNETLNRLKSCASLSSHSIKSQKKIKIPPAFVPDEWVCNHKHKRHDENSKAVKHVYVRPQAVKRHSLTQAKDKPKAKRVLSPIQASINLRATPHLEIIKKLEVASDSSEQIEISKNNAFENNEICVEANSERFERLNVVLRELKAAHTKRFFNRNSKQLKLKRLKKSIFSQSRKVKSAKKCLKPSSLVNLREIVFKTKKILMRIVSAKKLKGKIGKKVKQSRILNKKKEKKRLRKIRKNFLLQKTENFYFYIFSRKKYKKL